MDKNAGVGKEVDEGAVEELGEKKRQDGITSHSASVEGQFRQISIVPKTLSLILDDIFRSYGMCLENIWLVFMHFSHFMAH